MVEEVGFFVPNRTDSRILLPQREFSTGQLPSRGRVFNPLQWDRQDRQTQLSASCADVLDTFGENVHCSDWREGLEQPVGKELARLESHQLSGVWWDPLLSISGYANHLCVTVSAEQDLLDSSEDTVFNQSLFTSFEQDSVDFGSGTSETNEDVRDSINSVQGNLSKCYEFWKNTLSAPESVLNIISNGYVLPFKDQPPRKVFRNHSNCVKYEQFIDESIRDLVAERCAKPVKELPHVCNPLSVVCSRKGKLRLVLDLRYVNR